MAKYKATRATGETRRKNGEPKRRKPGGGRRRKDLGETAQAVTWHAIVTAIFRAELAPKIPLDGMPDDLSKTEKEVKAEEIKKNKRWHEALDSYLKEGTDNKSTGNLDDRFDEALDQKFHQPERTFQAIRCYGRDPGASLRSKRRLVDVVGAHPGYEHTVAIYDSLYWELITRPRPSEKRVSTIIQLLLAKKGLYRATDHEAEIGVEYATDTTPFRPGTADAFKTGINVIKSGGHVDDLGLLGALFREAVYHASFHQAVVIDDAFEWCLMVFGGNYSIDGEIEALLHSLSHYRIFKDRWGTVPDPESLAMARVKTNQRRRKDGRRELSTKKDIWRVQALALRFNNRSAEYRHPIVPLSEEIVSVRNRLRESERALKDK